MNDERGQGWPILFEVTEIDKFPWKEKMTFLPTAPLSTTAQTN